MITGMTILDPVTIGDGNLTSSSVPETDYSPWATGPTSYALGAHVIRAHHRWESLVASNVGNDPLTSPTKWVDMGPTNRYAMFDESVGTVTSADAEIEVVIAPGRVDSIVLLDVRAELVSVTMTAGGDTVYSETASAYGTGQAITNLYLYFTARVGRRSTISFENMPLREDGVITLTAESEGPGHAVEIGTMAVGRQLEIGTVQSGVPAGILDYSKKTTDDYGNTRFAVRSFAKRMRPQVRVPATSVDRVYTALAALRARPIVWIASRRFDCLVVYGRWASFEFDVHYGDTSYLSLDIDGII